MITVAINDWGTKAMSCVIPPLALAGSWLFAFVATFNLDMIKAMLRLYIGISQLESIHFQ